MSTSLYLQCVAMFILGQALDLFLMKIPELRKLYAKTNEKFNWNKYWAGDWNVIVGAWILCAILVIGQDQLLTLKPGVADYLKWLYVALGGFGSSIVVTKWGSAKQYILNIIDVKANIVSNDIGKTNGITELKQVAKSEGKDITFTP